MIHQVSMARTYQLLKRNIALVVLALGTDAAIIAISQFYGWPEKSAFIPGVSGAIITFIFVTWVIWRGYVPFDTSPESRALSRMSSSLDKTDENESLPREGDACKLGKIILETAAKPIALIGPSGAGKSHFAKQDLDHWLTRNEWKTVYIDRRDSLQSELIELQEHEELIELQEHESTINDKELVDSTREHSGTSIQKVIILDHFERFIEASRAGAPFHDETIEALTKFMAILSNKELQKNIRLIIISKGDFYYEILRIFEQYGWPDLYLWKFQGIKQGSTAAEKYKIMLTKKISALSPEVPNFAEDTRDEILKSLTLNDTILPIEAKYYLDVITHMSQRNILELGRDIFGSKQRILEEYIFQKLNLLSNDDLGITILYCLCLIKPYGLALSAENISEIIHENITDTDQILNELFEIGLIPPPINYNYEFPHDYFTSVVKRIASHRLRGQERDNISYFAQRLLQGGKNIGNRNIDMKIARKTWYADAAFLIMGAFVAIRLWSPALELDFCSIRPTALPCLSLSKSAGSIDWVYLPIALVHWTGVTYAYFMHVRVFKYIGAHKKNIVFLSVNFLIFWAVIVVILGTFFPEYWTAVVGLYGWMFAIGLFSLSLLKDLPSSSRKILRGICAGTIIGHSFLIAISIGIFIIWFRGYVIWGADLSPAFDNLFFWATWLGCAFTTLFILHTYMKHADRGPGAVILGLIDRP